jgi:dihydroorotase
LGIGSLADLCLVDLEEYWMVGADTLLSQGKHTPFLGRELPAKVVTTIVAGNIAYEAAR